MHGRSDGVDKSLVGIGREIGGDLRCGRNGTRDFDVEFDFTIGSAGISSGGICAAVNGDSGDLRSFQPEISEERIEVGSVVSTTQLDNSNTLSCAGGGGARRKSVRFRDLKRRVRNLCCIRVDAWLSLAQTEMRFGLRAIVEPETSLDDRFEICRNGEGAGATAVRAGRVFVTAKVRAESGVECLDRSAEFHRPSGAVLVYNFQMMLRSKGADFFKVGRGSAVHVCKLFAG